MGVRGDGVRKCVCCTGRTEERRKDRALKHSSIAQQKAGATASRGYATRLSCHSSSD